MIAKKKKLQSKIVEKIMKINQKVRDVIKDRGGTMPKNLPIPNKSLKELERKKQIKNEP